MNFLVSARRELVRLQQRLSHMWNSSQSGGAIAIPMQSVARRVALPMRTPVATKVEKQHRATGLITIALLVGIGVMTFVVRSAFESASSNAPVVKNESPSSVVPIGGSSTESNGRNGNALVLLAGAPLFPIGKGEPIAGEVNAPFVAQGAAVFGISGDKGFWLGESAEQRVFVTIPEDLGANGSKRLQDLSVGQRLNVFGRTAEAPYDPGVLGLSGADADLLNTERRLVVANSVNPM